MQKLNFICTFKSDIVLHASSNTEGKIERLHYIPGSNFLGMVARDYTEFKADAFDVFHSGEVCFSDGHILVENEPTFAMPYSFQTYKGESFGKTKELLNHHFLSKEDYECATNKGTQLKQQREGFITHSGKKADYSHSYKQKSAYDKHKRRSKDSQMFGYYALPAGTKWAFSVTMPDNFTYEEKIKELLEDSKRLGKSKSAEYGLVEIRLSENSSTENINNFEAIEIENKKYLFLYAKSRLALTDTNGVNSYDFDIISLGFSPTDTVKIDWEKSQIRTSRYTPYVGARRNFDPERLVVDKGSVIAVEILGAYDKPTFEGAISKPIGLYISEGHGEVWVNPSWLTEKEVFENNTQDKQSSTTKSIKENKLNTWLTSQREETERQHELLAEVQAFISKNNVQNKKSQWGQIRSLCRQAKDSKALYELLFRGEKNSNDSGFLMHGRALSKWDDRLIDAVRTKANYNADEQTVSKDFLAFMKLLSIYAPKEDDKGGE